MLYHVVRRHPNTGNSSESSRNNQRSGSVPPSPTLMPRYHYSRTLPNSASNHSDSVSLSNHLDTKSNMTAMTMTNNNNNHHQTPSNSSYASFKSTIIPLLGNNQTTTMTNKREVVQIPITKEESTRSIPINVVNETNSMPPTGNNNNHGNLSPRTTFTSLLRPTAKYFQYQRDNSTEDSSAVPRLPSVSRRLSLTIPVTTIVTTNPDDEVMKTSTPLSTTRQIPIRFSQATTTTATPTSIPPNNSRISSAIFRSSPVSNNLQRQKTDIGDSSSSTPALSSNVNSSPTSDSRLPTPLRRAEVLAREAIQGLTRLHHQRTNPIPSDSNPNRLSALSRRIIINLKNNQSVSLDSRLSSALKPPPIPSGSRHTQRNNLYHIPVLHEIQMPTHPTTTPVEDSPPSTSNGNNHFKNEFRMELPVTIDQENRLDFHPRERLPSSTNHTLKSILKRSSSRETVSRKNIEGHYESFDLSNSKTQFLHQQLMKEEIPVNEKRESTKRKCLNPSMMISAKRLCISERDSSSFDCPIEIGRFIYVPIPVVSSSIIYRPLDLRISKSDKEQEEKIYQCQFCSIRFRLRETLQAHQENYCLVHQKQKYSPSDRTLSYTCHHPFHDQSLLFKCLICSAMFNEENDLLDHIRCIHINSKLIQCLECRSKFSSKWNLIRHMKILHTNIHIDSEEKYSELITSTQMRNNYCSFCQISFRQKSSYQAHRLFYCAEKISS